MGNENSRERRPNRSSPSINRNASSSNVGKLAKNAFLTKLQQPIRFYDWEFCVPGKLNGDKSEEEKKPWMIKLSPELTAKIWKGKLPTKEQFLELFETGNTNVRVAFLGRFSTGKTHVLNQLTGREFPEGALPSAMDGLSFATIENTIYIDTPGIGAPSPNNRQMTDDVVDPSSDSNYVAEVSSKLSQSEVLLRNISWSISDVFFFVVGIMTQEEDLAIARAKKLAKRNHRPVIVVHNWWAVKGVTIEDWKKFIITTYGKEHVRFKQESGAVYAMVDGVKHVHIGSDDNAESSIHNAQVYNYLKMLIVGAPTREDETSQSILYEVLQHCANSLTTKAPAPTLFSVKNMPNQWTPGTPLQVTLERNFEISRNVQLSLDSHEVCPISIAKTNDKMYIYAYTAYNDSINFTFEIDKAGGEKIHLVISGRNPVPMDDPDAIWPYRERAAGRFTRKIRIGAEYDTSTIEGHWLGKVGCYELVVAKKIFHDFKGDSMEEDSAMRKNNNDEPVSTRREDDILPPLRFSSGNNKKLFESTVPKTWDSDTEEMVHSALDKKCETDSSNDREEV